MHSEDGGGCDQEPGDKIHADDQQKHQCMAPNALPQSDLLTVEVVQNVHDFVKDQCEDCLVSFSTLKNPRQVHRYVKPLL